MLLTLAFAAATLAMVAVSLRRAEARATALVLAIMWAVGIATSLANMPRDPRFTINVALDTIAAIGFVVAWRIIWPPKNWLFVLALVTFAQVAAHRVFSGSSAVYRLNVTLNILYALQLLTVVIGPRVGQIVGHARDVLSDWFPAPSDRVRGRGFVARADDLVCKVGERSLREKSR